MGSSPKTKADYRAEIAEKQALIAHLRGLKVNADAAGKRHFDSQISLRQEEIARLKERMAKAPK